MYIDICERENIEKKKHFFSCNTFESLLIIRFVHSFMDIMTKSFGICFTINVIYMMICGSFSGILCKYVCLKYHLKKENSINKERVETVHNRL